ncbi:MAG: aminotransferase class V-fold PLP-dependent enzyme [Gammaproteobacteria bacterium]
MSDHTDLPDPTTLAREFRLDPDVAYLNHAAVAPWPARTAEAVARFAAENLQRGAQYYPRWLALERRLRERLARLLGAASADDIALLKSTSEGLSLVAHGLGWAGGENVVGVHADFPSNRVVWQSLTRYGVSFRGVDVVAATDPEQALIDACDRDTRLLAVSSVHFVTGLRLDLARLGAFCRRRGILFCVDAIQSLGAVPLDVDACEVDFLAADGHKWLTSPEGLAVFYCRPELRERLTLYQYGWHMLEHPGDYDRLDWQPAATAARFECGSPNMLGIHGMEASLSLIEEVGSARIATRLAERLAWLDERLRGRIDWRVATPSEPERRAGIFTLVPASPAIAEAAYQHLVARSVVCANRGGGIRFSPHWHTPTAVLERAALELAAFCASGSS